LQQSGSNQFSYDIAAGEEANQPALSHDGDAVDVLIAHERRDLCERLFCRNERAVIGMRLQAGGHPIALVPVAAILVASLRLHCVNLLLHLRYRGPKRIDCRADYRKGDEMGWFEHGSTIIVFAPRGFTLAEGIVPGTPMRMGQALMKLPRTEAGE